jgi:hypothetical protein
LLVRSSTKQFSSVVAGGNNGFLFQPATAVATTTTNTNAAALSSLSFSTKTVAEGAAIDTMETGTKLYMSLYLEESTDGAIRLGNIVPDFKAETTQGPMESFHEWKKGKWAILFHILLILLVSI